MKQNVSPPFKLHVRALPALNPSNQTLENAIQFLCSLDIPPISRTLPLYSKMNSEKRVSIPTYNNEIPFSEQWLLDGTYLLPDQFMNIGLDRVHPPPA